MKISTCMIALLAIAIATPLFAAEDHGQHQMHHGELTLDHGAKWATDEPLRAGMEQIRSAMALNLERIHRMEQTTSEYTALATTIRQQVNTIVTQCKLKPEADANLHIIIADLFSGADAMQGKGDAAQTSGAHQIIEALHTYGAHFNHPGWRNLP